MSFQVSTAERATRVVSVSLGLSELLPMETGVSGRATAVTLSISLLQRKQRVEHQRKRLA